MKVIIIVLSFILFGCDKNRDIYSADCDSGFNTGDAIFATIDGGNIHWEDLNGKWHTRKMLNGEICQTNRKPR